MCSQPLSRVQARWGCKTPALQAAVCSVGISVPKALIYLKHLPPGAAPLEPELDGPTERPCPLPSCLPALGMEEKRPQQAAATAGATPGQVHLQNVTARSLHKTPNSHSKPGKGKPRGDLGFSPLLLAGWLTKAKQKTRLKLLSLPKTNTKLPSPQSIRKTVKRHSHSFR